MAGRPKYSQEVIDRALGALTASAVERAPGVWVPQYSAVARQVSVSEGTLRRWWRSRDMTKDVELRRAHAHVRQEVRQEGVQTWLEQRVAELKKGVEWLLEEERRLPQTRYADGVEYTIEQKPDVISRSLKDVTHIISKIDELTRGEEDTTDSPLSAAEEAASRTGLLDRLPTPEEE